MRFLLMSVVLLALVPIARRRFTGLAACLIAGAFAASLPVSQDMENYLAFYESGCGSGALALMAMTGKEPVFILVSMLLSRLTGCVMPGFFMFAVATLGFASLYVGSLLLSRELPDPKVRYLLAVGTMTFPMLFEGTVHLVRQIWALGIILAALSLKSMWLSIAASSIHISSLISLVATTRTRSAFLASTVVVLMALFGSFVAAMFPELAQVTVFRLLGLVQGLGEVELRSPSALAMVVHGATPALLYFCHVSNMLPSVSGADGRTSRVNAVLLFSVVIAAVFFLSVATGNTEMATRISYYQYPLVVFAISVAIYKAFRPVAKYLIGAQVPLYCLLLYLRNPF